jgi:hypothetical protein
MLLLILSLSWLAVTILIVTACWVASKADARPARATQAGAAIARADHKRLDCSGQQVPSGQQRTGGVPGIKRS